MLKKSFSSKGFRRFLPRSPRRKTHVKRIQKRRNRIIFSPPDEILQRSERKRKVVHQKDDKNKSKFSTNLALSPGVQTQQNIFEGSECTKQTNHGGCRKLNQCLNVQKSKSSVH